MLKTVLGIFADRDDAVSAIDDLKSNGYNPKDISIVMKNRSEGKEVAHDTGADVVGGAATGATTGAILGGLAGLLASFAIPGLGAFFIGGPIAAALGLTGAAASTASGAATGALAGGLLGALTGLGLSDDEAKEYEERINQGGILVAVPARAGEDFEVREILEQNGADQIKAITAAPREEIRVDDDMEDRSFRRDDNFDRSSAAYSMGAKGGQSDRDDDDGRGWHGDSDRHADAARKGGSSSRDEEWPEDHSEGHSLAGQGKRVPKSRRS